MKNDLRKTPELDLEYEVIMGLVREKLQIIYRNIDENNIKPNYQDSDYREIYNLLDETVCKISNKNRIKLLTDLFRNQY